MLLEVVPNVFSPNWPIISYKMCHKNLLFLKRIQGRHFQMRTTWHMTCRTITGLRRCSQWISHSIPLGSSLRFMSLSLSLLPSLLILSSYSLSVSLPLSLLFLSLPLFHLLLNSVAIGGCKNLRRIRNPQAPTGL